MAQGMPTILTDAHGHADFAHLGIPISASLTKSGYFIYGDAGDWWEPDFEQLCEAMWDTYQHYEIHAARAHQNAGVIARDWTWANSAQAYIDAHDGEMDKPYHGAGTHHFPVQKLYPVMVERYHRCEIAGSMLQFHPWHQDEHGNYLKDGERRLYWESADVKRILFEAERLHPDCLVDFKVGDESGVWDVGLDKGQAEKIPGYTARHAYCNECGQRLGDKPTLTDDILTEMEEMANRRVAHEDDMYEEQIMQAGA